MIEALLHATPFLAGGFVTNLLIAGLSMGLGTMIGLGLAAMRGSGQRWIGLPGDAATSLCRNVPSFVLLFYVAFMLPVEVEIAGRLLTVPLWTKATVALTIPVIGFASDQGLGLSRQRAAGDPAAGATFFVAWMQYFLIIVMASATASVIGADEIVGRANRIIAQDPRPAFLMLTYLYVSLWFIAAGLAFNWSIGRFVASRTENTIYAGKRKQMLPFRRAALRCGTGTSRKLRVVTTRPDPATERPLS